MELRRALAVLICGVALSIAVHARADATLSTGYGLAPRSDRPAIFSAKRKLAVGILSGLLAGTLATSIALQVVDGRETRDLSCAPSSRFCFFHNLGLYATGYAVSGVLAVGLALTLAWPKEASR